MLEINEMKFPEDRKYYTKDGAHIWLKQEGDLVKIGMDAFAAEMVGLLTFLKVNEGQVRSGEAIGSFESAKFVSRFYSPLNGEIVEVNDEVINNPRKINDSPYDSWIVVIKPDTENEDEESIIEGEERISKWITEEIKRAEDDE
ncbi:MAG: glycine cleavage system protein H [Promethearchaeota archaeon]|jgi:glycine cleavage system H protein